MNYRKLKGLESKDKWGNETKIIDVDTDVIIIATYRNHKNNCTTREIWRDDYYPEPSLHGGYERMYEELELCGFDLDILKENIDLSYDNINLKNQKFMKEYLLKTQKTPNTFA
jgi:hypothetical protein